MKKSEMKAQMDAQREATKNYVAPPHSYIHIRCKEQKRYDCCWSCDVCGRSGCNNMLGFRTGIDSCVVVECDLED